MLFRFDSSTDNGLQMETAVVTLAKLATLHFEQTASKAIVAGRAEREPGMERLEVALASTTMAWLFKGLIVA